METHPDLTSSVVYGLGWLYFLLFLMNVGWAYRAYKLGIENTFCGKAVEIFSGSKGAHIPSAGVWAFFSGVFLLTAIAHFTGSSNPESFLIRMPEFAKGAIDYFADPVRYFALSIGLFVAVVVRLTNCRVNLPFSTLLLVVIDLLLHTSMLP